MARYYHEQQLRSIQLAYGLHQYGFFAFARAGREHHRPRLSPLRAPRYASRDLRRIGCHVEFEIARYHDRRSAQGPQAIGIGFALGRDAAQLTEARRGMRAETPITAK